MAKHEVHIVLQGIEPLMMNPPSEEEKKAIGSGVKAPKKRNVPPEKTASQKIIRDPEGRICLRDDHLYGCLVSAGRSVDYQTRKKITPSTPGMPTKLFSILKIQEKFLPLFDGQPGKEPAWEVDERLTLASSARGGGQQRVMQIRPLFPSWGLECTIIVDDSIASLETVRELFDIAGTIGLGSYRGRYGLFRVEKWEVLN